MPYPGKKSSGPCCIYLVCVVKFPAHHIFFFDDKPVPDWVKQYNKEQDNTGIQIDSHSGQYKGDPCGVHGMTKPPEGTYRAEFIPGPPIPQCPHAPEMQPQSDDNKHHTNNFHRHRICQYYRMSKYCRMMYYISAGLLRFPESGLVRFSSFMDSASRLINSSQRWVSFASIARMMAS